jgi:hypothetical protein
MRTNLYIAIYSNDQSQNPMCCENLIIRLNETFLSSKTFFQVVLLFQVQKTNTIANKKNIFTKILLLRLRFFSYSFPETVLIRLVRAGEIAVLLVPMIVWKCCIYIVFLFLFAMFITEDPEKWRKWNS